MNKVKEIIGNMLLVIPSTELAFRCFVLKQGSDEMDKKLSLLSKTIINKVIKD